MTRRLIGEGAGLAAVLALFVLIPRVMGGTPPPAYVLVTFSAVWTAIRLSMVLPSYVRKRDATQAEAARRS